jgi:hypothetical protein
MVFFGMKIVGKCCETQSAVLNWNRRHTHTRRQTDRQNGNLVRTRFHFSIKRNPTDRSRTVFGRFWVRISAGKHVTLTEVFRGFIQVSSSITSQLLPLISFTIQSLRASSIHILHMQSNLDLLICLIQPQTHICSDNWKLLTHVTDAARFRCCFWQTKDRTQEGLVRRICIVINATMPFEILKGHYFELRNLNLYCLWEYAVRDVSTWGHGEYILKCNLQLWREAENILNKLSRTADKGWSSSLGVGRGDNHSLP